MPGRLQMAYRDSFENCPRCRIALDDAGAVRACSQCSGQWVQEPVLAEMVLRMLPPGEPPFGRLFAALADRSDPTLGCPSCGERMEPVTIHGVTLDRCPRLHGIWFDPEELAQSLQAIAVHGMPADAVPPPPSSVPSLRIVFESPSDEPQLVITRTPIIKIGRLHGCHVRIESDPNVGSLHAVIEIAGDELRLIDLGTRAGTLVNGTPIGQHVLRPGDRIVMGTTTLNVALNT